MNAVVRCVGVDLPWLPYAPAFFAARARLAAGGEFGVARLAQSRVPFPAPMLTWFRKHRLPADDSSESSIPWGPLSLSLGLLALEGAAAALFVALLVLFPQLPAWLEKNQVPASTRANVAHAIFSGAALAAAGAAVALACFRKRAISTVVAVAEGLVVLIPLGVLPALFCTDLWSHLRIAFVCILAGYGLLLERLARTSIEAIEASFPRVYTVLGAALDRLRRPWAPLAIVIVLAGAYAAYTAHMTILNHHRMGTGAFDLALEDNIVFNFMHGRGFRSSVMFGTRGGNALADHARLTMVALVPFYALWPKAECLLLLQALFLGFAAIPLYLFASTQISRGLALVVAAAYLFYAPTHTAQFYDFHWLVPAVFFHFVLFWAMATKRYWLVAIALPLLLGMREDVGPEVMFVGLFLLFSGARPGLGAVLFGAGTAFFIVLKFVVMPWAGSWSLSDYYQDLIVPGEKGYGSVVKTLFTNPLFATLTVLKEQKLEYFLHMAAPLVFLPFRRAPLAILFVPAVFFTLLATRGPCYSLGYQYVMHWVPFLFAGLVLVLKELPNSVGSRARPAAVVAMTAVMLAHSTVFGVIIKPSSFVSAAKNFTSYSMTGEEKRNYADLRELIDMIPKTASVTATDIESPHLSNRLDVYAIAQDDSAGEYLLVNTRSLHLARSRQNLATIWQRNRYGLLAKRGTTYFLFRNGHTSNETAAAAREIGIP
jgi:uncharacterized membrane protein